MQVGQILNSKQTGGGIVGVVTVLPHLTGQEAARLMVERHIGALIVSPDGVHLAGILNERDMVHAAARYGCDALDLPVETLMSGNVATCSLGHTADHVVSIMTENRFRHLPVLDDGKLIGIISLGDVVKARLDELARENSALEGMIAGTY